MYFDQCIQKRLLSRVRWRLICLQRKKPRNKKVHHTLTMESIVITIKKGFFYVFFSHFFSRSFFARTLKSASIKTIVLFVLFTLAVGSIGHSGQLIDCFFSHLSLNVIQQPRNYVKLPQKVILKPPFSIKILKTKLPATACPRLNVSSIAFLEASCSLQQLLLATDWRSQSISKKWGLIGFWFQ